MLLVFKNVIFFETFILLSALLMIPRLCFSTYEFGLIYLKGLIQMVSDPYLSVPN